MGVGGDIGGDGERQHHGPGKELAPGEGIQADKPGAARTNDCGADACENKQNERIAGRARQDVIHQVFPHVGCGRGSDPKQGQNWQQDQKQQ